MGNGLLDRGFGAADLVKVIVPIACTACTRARPSTRCTKTILRARSAAIAHVLSLTFLSNVVAYVCRAPPGRTGIMFALVDNLPQRHCWVTRRAAAPDVDFRTSMRWGSMCSCDDPCSRNSPSPACHAKPSAIGISLAEIAGITNSWQQRPARAEPRDWRNACGNCAKPCHGPPARYRDRIEGRAERSKNHFSGSIAVRKYSWGRHWKEKWHDRRPARQLVGCLAGQ
jgi:hypothetical protein